MPGFADHIRMLFRGRGVAALTLVLRGGAALTLVSWGGWGADACSEGGGRCADAGFRTDCPPKRQFLSFRGAEFSCSARDSPTKRKIFKNRGGDLTKCLKKLPHEEDAFTFSWGCEKQMPVQAAPRNLRNLPSVGPRTKMTS